MYYYFCLSQTKISLTPQIHPQTLNISSFPLTKKVWVCSVGPDSPITQSRNNFNFSPVLSFPKNAQIAERALKNHRGSVPQNSIAGFPKGFLGGFPNWCLGSPKNPQPYHSNLNFIYIIKTISNPHSKFRPSLKIPNRKVIHPKTSKNTKNWSISQNSKIHQKGCFFLKTHPNPLFKNCAQNSSTHQPLPFPNYIPKKSHSTNSQ